MNIFLYQKEKKSIILLSLSILFFFIGLICSLVENKAENQRSELERSTINSKNTDTELAENQKAKEEILKEFSENFQLDPETLESQLVYFANRVDYEEKKKLSPKKLSEKLKKEVEKNKRDIYSSIPKNSEEFQQGIENYNHRFSLIVTALSLPRNENGIDWKKKLEEKNEQIENLSKSEIEKKLEEIKDLIEKDFNSELKNEKNEFNRINNLDQFNQWMNNYLSKITIGEYLLKIRDEIASKIGKVCSHNLVNYDLFENESLGINMISSIFSC
jgi:hypothetical protein